VIYTTKILKAGALLPDTLELLLNWNEDLSVNANLTRLRQSNIFGKATRERGQVIMRIFRQRYLTDERIGNSLVVLAKNNLPTEMLKPILYFFTVGADALLRDTVLLFLAQRRASGVMHIDTEDLKRELREWIRQGRITDDWSESTLTKVARGLLATLRDFGILQGASKKTVASVHLPVVAFAYIAFYLKTIDQSGDLLVKNPLWGLFFLTPAEVERFFVQADQLQLLSYQAAGSVIRIDFPADKIEDYVHVILRAATRIT